MNLKAAFDILNRKSLVKIMKKREIRKGLVDTRYRNRCGEILIETKSRVRIGGEVGKVFLTAREVR